LPIKTGILSSTGAGTFVNPRDDTWEGKIGETINQELWRRGGNLKSFGPQLTLFQRELVDPPAGDGQGGKRTWVVAREDVKKGIAKCGSPQGEGRASFETSNLQGHREDR